jgi:hypothetical protein
MIAVVPFNKGTTDTCNLYTEQCVEAVMIDASNTT